MNQAAIDPHSIRKLYASYSGVFIGFAPLLMGTFSALRYGPVEFGLFVAGVFGLFVLACVTLLPKIHRDRLKAVRLVSGLDDPVALDVILGYLSTKRSKTDEIDMRDEAYVETVRNVLRRHHHRIGLLHAGVMRTWAESLPSEPRADILAYLDEQPNSLLHRKL